MAFLTKREIFCFRQLFQAFALNINGIAKVNKVRFSLVWSSRLAKTRACTRLEELDCIELVVMVDWDDNINDAVVAIDINAGLD